MAVVVTPVTAALRSVPQPHHVLVATVLTSGVEAAAQAREVVRDLLRQGRRLEMVETACLLTSELVANAVLHAGAPVELVVELDRSRLSIEVIDCSEGDPEMGTPAPLDTHGRGIDLVARLSDSWGVTHVRPGKSVWFALDSADPGG